MAASSVHFQSYQGSILTLQDASSVFGTKYLSILSRFDSNRYHQNIGFPIFFLSILSRFDSNGDGVALVDAPSAFNPIKVRF